MSEIMLERLLLCDKYDTIVEQLGREHPSLRSE